MRKPLDGWGWDGGVATIVLSQQAIVLYLESVLSCSFNIACSVLSVAIAESQDFDLHSESNWKDDLFYV